jgi:head-tail adaptor
MRRLIPKRAIRALQSQVVNPSLNDRCALQNPSTTSDGQGGLTEGWTTAAANVPVRIGYGVQAAYEYLVGEQFQGQARVTLTFKASQVVSAKQRAYFPSSGRIIQIHGFMDAGELRVSIRAYCTEIQ